MAHNKRNPSYYGLGTAATLVGGMALGIATGILISETLPGHMPARDVLAAIPALAGLLGSGTAWGWLMNRLAQTQEPRRAAWAGALGFSLPTFVAMLTLFALEGAVEAAFRLTGAEPPPIHRIFTLMFVPTAVLLAASGAWALAVALRKRESARGMALRSGLASGAGFLIVNLVMESLGWVVGAPGAAERATMITVLAVSCLGAALAGGTVLGVNITHYADENTESARTPISGEQARLAQDHQG